MFVGEWNVDAPIEAVFETIADARTYPEWRKPVYIETEADGPARLGALSRESFQGRLPYKLRTRSETVRLESPTTVEVDVEGDLRGKELWTLPRDTVARTSASTGVCSPTGRFCVG